MTDNKYTTTQEVAKALDYHIGSIYNTLSRSGGFHGITPIKQLNGKLLWPTDEVNALLTRQAVQGA